MDTEFDNEFKVRFNEIREFCSNCNHLYKLHYHPSGEHKTVLECSECDCDTSITNGDFYEKETE